MPKVQVFFYAMAAAIFGVFILQTGWDLVSPDYEVPAGMYGLLGGAISAASALALGVQVGKGKDDDKR